MNYSSKCYHKIFETLKKFSPIAPAGQAVRRLTVFALMIVGLIRAGKTSLEEMANKSPKHERSKTTTRAKRFDRWLNNRKNCEEVMYFPYILEILAGLSGATLVFSIDASSLGKHCAVLMISVIYKGRALPVVWEVKKGNKGSFAQDMHVDLLNKLNELLEELAEKLDKELDVVIVGDGEFDGIEVQETCADYGWKYVVRAAKNINCYEEESKEPFKPEDISQKGECVNVENVAYTDQKYGPVIIIAWWDDKYENPIYLVSNLELAEEACELYKKRCLIETFFSDEKSRGFHLQKTRIKNPKKLSKLLLVACFAYLWVVYLGAMAIEEEKEGLLGRQRKDHKTLSLFQLGKRYLEYLLECNIDLPSGLFKVPNFWEEQAWL